MSVFSIFGTVLMLFSLVLAIVSNIRLAFGLQLIAFPISNIYVSGMVFLVSMFFCFYTEIVWKKRQADISIPWAVLLVWFIWLLIALGSFYDNEINFRNLFQFLEFGFVFAVFLYFYNIAKPQYLGPDLFVRLVMISALCLSSVFIITKLTVVGWPENLIGRNEGSFFLMLTGVLFPTYQIYKKQDRLLSYLVLCTSYCAILVSTDSRYGVLFGVFLISCFLVVRATNFSVPFLCFAILSLVVPLVLLSNIVLSVTDYVAASAHSNFERVALLSKSLELLLEKPLFGWGWGSVEFLLTSIPNVERTFNHPHNTYARVAIELGLIGLTLLLLSYMLLLLKGWRLIKCAPTEAFLTIFGTGNLIAYSMVGSILYGASRSFTVALFLAVVFSQLKGIEIRKQGATTRLIDTS